MFRRDGDFFLFGTAMAVQLLQKSPESQSLGLLRGTPASLGPGGKSEPRSEQETAARFKQLPQPPVEAVSVLLFLVVFNFFQRNGRDATHVAKLFALGPNTIGDDDVVVLELFLADGTSGLVRRVHACSP